MIPNFTNNGLLPKGVHYATLLQVEERFAINEHRKNLIVGLKKGLNILFAYGCDEVYIDGSFTTDKEKPGDIDVCFSLERVRYNELLKIHPEFFDTQKGPYLQRKKYLCEFYSYDNYDTSIIDYFLFSRQNEPKGIVKLNL